MNPRLGVLALLVSIFAMPAVAQRHHAVVMPPADHADMHTGLLGLGASVSGIVQTVSGSLITIANGTITIDASKATILTTQGGTVTAAAIHAGDRVDVIAESDNVAPGAPIVAQRIVFGRVDVIAITGTIQSIDAARKTFTIFGRTINAAPDTKFTGVKSFNDLLVGEHVGVAAELRGGGLTALTIVDMLANHTGTSAFFDATVKSISATQWVITSGTKDVTLRITPSTVIGSGISVGDKVNVLADYDGQNYTATVIGKTLGPLDKKFVIDVFGTVKSTGSTWVIHDQRSNADVSLLVTAETIVTPGIAVGDTVAATALNMTTPPTAIVIVRMPIVGPM
jgi:hypothetical protein